MLAPAAQNDRSLSECVDPIIMGQSWRSCCRLATGVHQENLDVAG